MSEAIEKAETEEKNLSPYETDEPEEVILRKLTIGQNLPDVKEMTLEERGRARALAQAMGDNYARRVRYFKNQLLEMPKDSPDRERLTPEKIDEYARAGSLNFILGSYADRLGWHELQTLTEENPDAAALVWQAIKRMAREDLAGGYYASNTIQMRETPQKYAQYLVVLESFMTAWEPRTAIEQAMVETLVQAHVLQPLARSSDECGRVFIQRSRTAQ